MKGPELLEKSLYFEAVLFFVFREQTKNIDVEEIRRDIYEAEKTQNKADSNLETASQDTDMTRDQVQGVKMDNISNLSQVQNSMFWMCLNMFFPSCFR